jgi:phosphoribosylformylglycinamidine synthase I
MAAKFRIGVVVFPGSNCDQDMVDALSVYESVEVVKLWHKAHDLMDADLVVLPGGFSYGDHLRSGAIARFSPIMREVIAFASSGGYVFGVCNGFQILCESQLLPGALLHNHSHSFMCKNVWIKAENASSAITKSLSTGSPLRIPIAHGEGRFFASDETLNSLTENELITFKYCSEQGEVNDTYNPNGSAQNIAGICNMRKNVFGMMPHPERAADYLLGNLDGRTLLTGFLENIAGEVMVEKADYMVSK